MIAVHERSWLTVESHAKAEIARLGARLEQTGLAQELTENLRGQIAALRGVLKLAEEESERTVTGAFDYLQK